jgi:hypothetical protein
MPEIARPLPEHCLVGMMLAGTVDAGERDLRLSAPRSSTTGHHSKRNSTPTGPSQSINPQSSHCVLTGVPMTLGCTRAGTLQGGHLSNTGRPTMSSRIPPCLARRHSHRRERAGASGRGMCVRYRRSGCRAQGPSRKHARSRFALCVHVQVPASRFGHTCFEFLRKTGLLPRSQGTWIPGKGQPRGAGHWPPSACPMEEGRLATGTVGRSVDDTGAWKPR